MFDLVLRGFGIVFTPTNFLLIFVGTVAGIILGALPGISASMAVVIAMTFSYGMEPLPAIAFLVAVYCAAITGGSITAILFSIPGTPASAVTTFDGYPMVMQGKAGKALGYTFIASAIGGLFSAFAMALLTRPLAKTALRFGPSEMFAVSFLGLSILTSLGEKNVIRTIISGLIGLWLATIGIDPIYGTTRFTFGNVSLIKGVPMIPVMTGLFAVVEVLGQMHKKESLDSDKMIKTKTEMMTFKEIWMYRATIVRGSLIGTIVGIIPGAGATIASFLAYAIEVKVSKNPENFGKGEPRGVVAPETANNAATGGAMVPLLALGIPGGNAAAIMLTALAIKGVNMGPLLLVSQPIYMYTTFASMFVVNIIMVVIAYYVAKGFAKILEIPYSMLGTIILMLCFLGAFSASRNISDVLLVVIAGIVGYGLSKAKFNMAGLVLGLVLGPIVEKNLRNAIVIAQGNLYDVFIAKPITLVMLIIIVILFMLPLIQSFMKSKERETAQLED